MLAVAVTRDGQHIISGCGLPRQVWSVASKSLVSTCAGHQQFSRWRRCPTAAHSQRLERHTVRVWLLDGTLENTFELHTGT